MTRPPSVGATALRRLLVLARDLLQAPDLNAIVALLGPTLQELLMADEAMLLVELGEQEYVTGFNQSGWPQPADREGMLYRRARHAMDDRTPVFLPGAAPEAVGPASLLAFPFPPIRPVGVLAACWNTRGGRQQLQERIVILRYLGELTGAALGNVDFRQMLAQRVSAQTEEVAAAAREHAQELQRRDSIEEEIRRIAVTDVMTGMLNRRGFFLRAEQSFKLARRRRLPSALIFADIDHLKVVNDEFGHDAGDHFIQDVARILRNSFRDSDVVARMGGDEFAAFTVDSACPEAILGRIERNVETFQRESMLPYRLSFSTGIVVCDPGSGLSLSDYLSQADSLMYERKRERPD